MPPEYVAVVLVIYFAYIVVLIAFIWVFIHLDDILEQFP